MSLPELKAPERRIRPESVVFRGSDSKPGGKWYDDPLMVFGVLVGSTVAAAAIIWMGIEMRARYEAHQLAARAEATLRAFEARQAAQIQKIRDRQTQEEDRRDALAAAMNAAATETARLKAAEAAKWREWKVQHAPQSHEDCIALAQGYVGAYYNRCRSGWTERKRERIAP